MRCEKCGINNGVPANFCKICGVSLNEKHAKKTKTKKFFSIFLLLVFFGGAGYNIAKLNETDTEQAVPVIERAMSEKENSPEIITNSENVGEINEPEQPVATEEISEGIVVKPEDVIPPSKQPEKIEPKTKEKTAIIKEAQQKSYTILTESGQGSGFLFNDNGMVATNAHVVAGFTNVIVRNINGQDLAGRVVGISDTSDIALIKVSEFEEIAPLEIEMNKTDVGTEIIALGSPSGYENTASIGYLTGIDRDFHQEFIYEDIYQIDAYIAAGSSGGPLIDGRTGKVIGINSLVMTDVNTSGFSIPMYSVHAELTEWARNPMSEKEVVAKFHVYDEFSVVEDENFEYDVDLEMGFNESTLREFIGDFRYYYEMALKNEDFFYVQDLLVYKSDIYNGIFEYINDISGQGLEFNFTKLKILEVAIFEDHAVLQTEEAFDFMDGQGQWTLEERRKSYTIVMDVNGFYYISDIVNHE